jgi:hypothetical protein
VCNTSTEALKKALADSKFAGVKVGLLPLIVESSDQVPSMSDLEQYRTALARSTHSGKEMGSSCSPPLLVLAGLVGVPGVRGGSATVKSSLLEGQDWQCPGGN